MKKLEIEKTKPTFIMSVLKVDIIKVCLVFSISNFFITKTALANNWRRKKIPSCSYSAVEREAKFINWHSNIISNTYYKTQSIWCFGYFWAVLLQVVFFILSDKKNEYKISVGFTIKSWLWHFKVYFSVQNRQKPL